MGSRVERIGPIRFLARCRKRRLNQALSALCLMLGFYWVRFVQFARAAVVVWHYFVFFCVLTLVCSSSVVSASVKWLTGKTGVRNDLYNVLNGTLNLTHSLHQPANKQH